MRIEVDGQRLREFREGQLLSRRDLAEKTGDTVSVSTLERLEQHGGGGVYGRTVRALADALEVDPDELLVRGSESVPLNELAPDAAEQVDRASRPGKSISPHPRSIGGAGGIPSAEAFGTPEIVNIRLEANKLAGFLHAIERGEMSADEALVRIIRAGG